MPDWKAGDGVSRMLAAVMAANDNKVDCNKVASLLDSTYNSVEKRLRSFKQEATQLIQKAKDGGRLDKDGGVIKAVSATPTKTTTTAKKSALNGVATGRVTKKPSNAKKSKVKDEQSKSPSPIPFGPLSRSGDKDAASPDPGPFLGFSPLDAAAAAQGSLEDWDEESV